MELYISSRLILFYIQILYKHITLLGYVPEKKEKKLYSELFLIIAKQLRNIVIEIPDNMDEMNKQ